MNANTVRRMPLAEAKKNAAPSPTRPELVGAYVTECGGRVSIKSGDALDYANMRAAQLSSLLSVIHGAGGASFRDYSDSIQDDVLWLASGLSDELKELIQIVHDDAQNMTKTAKGAA